MQDKSLPAASVENVLARVRQLARRQARESQRCYGIEGVRQFVQAFDARVEFESVIHSRVLLQSDLAEMLARRLVAAGVRRVRVSPAQFRSISTTARASWIGALVRQKWTPL